MPPITIGAEEQVEATPQDIKVEAQAWLEDDDGNPTLEAEIIQTFLDEVDFDELFDVEGVAVHLTKSEAYLLNSADGYVEVEEGTEDAELGVIETLPGSVAAEVIDMDDLYAMFEYHVFEEMPEDTLEAKARKAVAVALLDLDERGMPYDKNKKKGMSRHKGKKKGSMHRSGHNNNNNNDDDEEENNNEDLEEKFKRGTFRKLSKQGGAPRALVNRMLGAMMQKQSIQRADAPGTGYKAGDYKKHPAGYSPGTPAGIKKWRKYRTKKKAQLAKAAKKTKKGLKALKIAGGAKAKKKAAPKKGAKALAKKGKKKKGIAASQPAPVGTVSEGAELASKIVGQGLGSRAKPIHPINEAKSD